jgi:hypothetical protein
MSAKEEVARAIIAGLRMSPGHIFRISARCEQGGCTHFSGHSCALAKRIVDDLPAVVEQLPACQIRPTCRWYHEQGRDACVRCPQVMTYAAESMKPLARVAMPPNQENSIDDS